MRQFWNFRRAKCMVKMIHAQVLGLILQLMQIRLPAKDARPQGVRDFRWD